MHTMSVRVIESFIEAGREHNLKCQLLNYRDGVFVFDFDAFHQSRPTVKERTIDLAVAARVDSITT